MTIHAAGQFTSIAELLDAPIPDVAAALAARRQTKRREAVLAERGLMLSPLVLLAACGGGGGGSGGGPNPPPPPPAPTITSQPDAASITAGAAPVTGNVLTNDTASSGTLTVSAVAVQGGTAGTVGQALAGTLGTLTVNADGSFTLANPTLTGEYTFAYRLGNVGGTPTAGGTADATVSI